MSAQRGFDRISQAGKVPPPDERVQILVVGGGPAGASAAIAAAKAGASVMLVDENPVSPGLMGLDTPLYFGGRYSNAVQAQGRMVEQILASNPLLEAAFEAGVDVRLGVYVWGAFTPGWGLASLPGAIAGLADEERAWMVGFERLILATGARDVAFAFRGWDQPGVMGARAFEALTGRYDAFAGRRLVVLGTGELAIRTARAALARGVEVAALVDVAETFRGPASAAAELAAAGVQVLLGQIPVAASGGLEGVEGLSIRDLASGATRTLVCDTVVEAISLTPVIELLDVLGGAIAPAPHLGGHAPVSPDGTATSLPNVFLAGDVAGAPGGVGMGEEAARASGLRAAHAALASLGREGALDAAPAREPGFDALAYQMAWARALMAEADVDHLPVRGGDPRRSRCGQASDLSRPALAGAGAPRSRQPARGRPAQSGPDQAPHPRLHGSMPGEALPRTGGADPRLRLQRRRQRTCRWPATAPRSGPCR